MFRAIALGVGFSFVAASLFFTTPVTARELRDASDKTTVAPVAQTAEHAGTELTGVARFSSFLGGLRKAGSYVTTISRDMGTISSQEVAVSHQYRCLAQAIYFEARGEPALGQQAIAHVILNRVRDSRYPSTICGVVYQNQNLPNRCQFSFACDGLSDKPYDSAAWQRSLKVALEVLAGVSPDVSRSSTHFHATHVEPLWATTMKPTVKLGQHMFYQDPGRDGEAFAVLGSLRPRVTQ